MSPIHHQQLRALGEIIARNVLVLTNGVIFLVAILLYIFGDAQAAIFLSLILLINITFGLGQDLRAWFALKNLEFITAPQVTRVGEDGTKETILTNEVKKGDLIDLAVGDQIPCDGILTEAHALELNEGLITGESNSFVRKVGEHVLAGSILTAGFGRMQTETVFRGSRMALMTEKVQRYSGSLSPIQKAVREVVRYAGYALVLSIAFVVGRGIFIHEPPLFIVKHVGALASILVPQGLVFTMTLLFAYGAAHLFRRNVLLQEINATEKLGRIKNLCMDKTGTLTENMLEVESMRLPEGVSREEATTLTAAYLAGSGDASQTMIAVKKFLNSTYEGEILDAFGFSSWRPYGAVLIDHNGKNVAVVSGSSESILPGLVHAKDRAWIADLIETEAKAGKRILCIARRNGKVLPAQLSDVRLSLVAVFVFASRLRPGIKDAIEFFQKRGVRIRIISGDHPETVRAVARASGVNECDKFITGAEMEAWSIEDFKNHAREYTIFARTIPEQKEKIIEALRHDGFTAMVGDGANDALAIKKADLGIAMFEGAAATRQVASVILTNNSFTALPGGVELADSIIRNAEIFASIFFNQALVGFFFFILVSMFGYGYPLTPLNITLINYFTVGIPGILISYWTLRPAAKVTPPTRGEFLRRVFPFTLISSLLQAFAILAMFAFSPEWMRLSASNLYVISGFISTGLLFFMFALRVFRGKLELSQVVELVFLFTGEILLFVCLFQFPPLLHFFDVTPDLPPVEDIFSLVLVLSGYVLLLSLLCFFYVKSRKKE